MLLVGDYSSVHYFLYLGLKEHGVDITLVSSGDGSKSIPTHKKWTIESSGRVAKILGVHGQSFERDNSALIESFEGYDIVQIINPIMIEEASIASNKRIFDKLVSRNGKVFLYSCGDDYNWVSSCLKTPVGSMFDERELFFSKEIIHPARYVVNPLVRRLCSHVYSGVSGIIPGSVDYSWSIRQLDKKREIVPFPVNLELFSFNPVVRKQSYEVLHGFQPGKAIRKGDKYFQEAMKVSSKAFTYRRVGGLPFADYLNLLGSGDVFFDQVHSRDRGMNAVFAMAKGKVAFSGFGEEFMAHYKLNSTVGVNATANSAALAECLELIVSEDIDVEEVSISARAFVELNHDHRKVASKFLNEWRD